MATTQHVAEPLGVLGRQPLQPATGGRPRYYSSMNISVAMELHIQADRKFL